MAKHLAPSSDKKQRTRQEREKLLPKVLTWKTPEKRVYSYMRVFSVEEMAPVLAAVILFLAAWLAPVSLLLKWIAYAASAFVAGFSILRRCFHSVIRLKMPDEDVLVLLASVLTFAAGRPAVGAILVIFGRVLELAEAYVLARGARGVEALRDFLPEKAHLVEELGLIDVVPEKLKEGDIFLVNSGETVPVDGEILEGESELEYSAFGGKEERETFGIGCRILAGGVNRGDSLRLRAVHGFEDSALAKYLESLANAGKEKTWIENTIERYAPFYTAAMLLLAAIVGVVAPLFHGRWKEAFSLAATILVLATPSTLILTVPLAFLGGLTSAAHNGIRLRAKVFLETLARARTVVFGKTGTITEGDFNIVEIYPNHVDETELLRIAAAAESFSRHPIAAVIKEAAGWTEEQAGSVLQVNDIPGRGVSAFIDGKNVYVGNAALLDEHGIHYRVPTRSGAAIHVAVDNEYRGYILLGEKIRESAFDAIEELRGHGIRNIVMLTGDVRSSTAKLARSLNFDMVKTELTPEEKLSAVDYLRKSLGKRESLIYVGDGFHDADMFKNADAGLALNAMGDESAEEAADIILMDGDLLRVPKAFMLASGVERIVMENVLAVAGGKLLLLFFSLCGLLSLPVCAFLHTALMCLASLNALRAYILE